MKNIMTYEEYNCETFEDFLYNFDYNKDDEELSCGSNDLLDINGIEQFTNLEKLACHDNYITSLEPIKDMIKLKKLFCHDNQITSLDPIKNLINLQELYFGDNKITSLEPIKNLINLEELSCRTNYLTSLKGVENLTKLIALYCWENPIDWVDYIDKKGNTWYIVLPESIQILNSDKFKAIEDYWEFMEKNQPASVSRKFNF